MFCAVFVFWGAWSWKTKCRADIPAVVFVAILKHAGGSSLVFRRASKRAKELVDAGYFRTCAPRMMVRCDITEDLLARVRRILVGPDEGAAGIVVLSLDSAPDDVGCVKSHLDRFLSDTVELRVAGDCVERSVNFQALAALRERISCAKFGGCVLKPWHVLALTRILPATLRRLSIESCVIEGPRGALPAALALFDGLSGLAFRHVTFHEAPLGFRFEALAPALVKMRDLVDLDLRGVIAHGSSITALTDFVGAAQRLRVLRLGGCLITVPVSLVRAIFSLRNLRELELSRCWASFEVLCEACGAMERESETPVPALEVLDLHASRFRFGWRIGAVGEFIRSVPSLKEIFLQGTGVTAADLADHDGRVLFHL